MNPARTHRAARLRRRLAGVRIRLTIVATVLLATALAAAAVIMLYVLHETLLASADSATAARAQEISSAIAVESVPGLDAGALTSARDIDVIQLIDRSGAIVTSNSAGRSAPITRPIAVGSRKTLDDATIGDGSDKFRVTVIGVRTPDGDVTIAVGASEGRIDDVVETVAVLLATVFPIILVVLAANTYYFSGRTLRSVERIRSQVAAVSGSDLAARVSVPDTGDEIARLAETMNEMLAGLEVARKTQLRFVGDASHELRSPLMTIVGLLDLSRTTRQPLDQATVETILLPEARRLQAMVDDLLLLARADERGIPLVVTDVDLDDIVGAEARRLGQLTPVTVEAHIEPIRVRGDHDKLTRAVRNVADNALRYARNTVALSMSVDETSGIGSVVVDDDGPGIAEPDRVRVLNRFVRLDADRHRSHGGSGLGLAIVDEIVGAHGGSVVIGESETLGGTRVTLTVPVGVI